MILIDPKPSADEPEPEESEEQQDTAAPPDHKLQEEEDRLKRFIWTEGDFEFEDDV